MKSILVTGGSGRVGNIIFPFLSKKYHIDNYDLLNGDDLFDAENLSNRMKNKFAVIHLAAIPHPKKGSKERYKKINFDGAKLVFDTAKKAGVRKFIFSSSGCAYGMWDGKTKPDKFPISEDNYKPTLEEGQTFYGYYKLEFENYLKENSDEKIRSIAFRLEIPKNEASAEHFFIKASNINVNKAFELALEKDLDNPFEAFNISDPKIPKYVKVQKWIEDNWPNVPNYTSGNETLYDYSKAHRLLGYNPIDPYDFNYYFNRWKKKIRAFASKHTIIATLGVFTSGFVIGVIWTIFFGL